MSDHIAVMENRAAIKQLAAPREPLNAEHVT